MATKHGSWGGRRKGSGRKLTDGQGTVPFGITLTPAQVAKIERWQEQKGCDSFSEAIREMIDAADEGAPAVSA
jgi:hypothetical protein